MKLFNVHKHCFADQNKIKVDFLCDFYVYYSCFILYDLLFYMKFYYFIQKYDLFYIQITFWKS